MLGFLRALALVLLSVFLLGATECKRDPDDPIVLAQGPQATALSKAKDEQIAGLVAQVKAEQEARELAQKQAALVAGNLTGILFGAEHVDAGLPRNAIEEEAKLGLARSPAPDPVEVLKAKDRVIAILQNEVDKAKALYGQAFNEAAQAKAVAAAKDAEIATRDRGISDRDGQIKALQTEVAAEQIKHINDVKDALAKKDKEMADYKTEEASKERRWLTNATRLAALGLIVAGALALAVLKMFDVGGGLVGAGVLVGLISIGIESLTSQPWWPYLCGTVFVLVVLIAIYGIYRLWVKHQLDVKKTQAIQDMIDEATAKGDTKAVDELKSNLAYRMGDSTSFWAKQQAKATVALGLVNPKGEAALAAAIPVPVTPPVPPTS